MKIRDWVGKIQQKLILGGTKLDETPETKVTMVTLNEQPQGRSQNSGTGNSRGNRGNGGQRPENRIRRFKSNTDGSPVTECGFCNLIQSKEVSQEYMTMNFNERHRNVTHLSIRSNNCLPWLKLSFDDRAHQTQSRSTQGQG